MIAAILDDALRAAYEERGFFRINGFADRITCDAMHRRAVELARSAATGDDLAPTFVTPEMQPGFGERTMPEDAVSKIFRLHPVDDVFGEFARRAEVVDLVAGIVGPDVDCFLSQFIFKNPGAWGQPWHQDSLYRVPTSATSRSPTTTYRARSPC